MKVSNTKNAVYNQFWIKPYSTRFSYKFKPSIKFVKLMVNNGRCNTNWATFQLFEPKNMVDLVYEQVVYALGTMHKIC